MTRASDSATMDVGFNAAGVADWASAVAFGGGSQLSLSIWYDQTGNGLHATSSGAAMPTLFGNKIGSVTGLDFTDTHNLVLPAGLSLSRQSMTAFTCIRPRGAYYSTFWTLGSTGALSGHFNGGWVEIYNGTNDLATAKWHLDQGVRVAQFTATDNIGWMDDRSVDQPHPGGALTMTGGYIPRSTSTLDGQYGALIFYPSVLTSADVASVRRSLFLAHNIAPQIRDRIVFCGDSISFGFVTANNIGWAQSIQPLLNNNWVYCNMGVPSQLQSFELTNVSDYTGFVLTGAKNVVVVFSGTNDIAANATAATVQTSTQSLCTALRSGGFNKIVVATMLPRAGGFSGGQTAGAFETARQTYNSWVRANWASFADALCDFGSDSTIMGQAATASNLTYYGDLIHPTTLGHSILAFWARNAINSLY